MTKKNKLSSIHFAKKDLQRIRKTISFANQAGFEKPKIALALFIASARKVDLKSPDYAILDAVGILLENMCAECFKEFLRMYEHSFRTQSKIDSIDVLNLILSFNKKTHSKFDSTSGQKDHEEGDK
mgnify:CR=1 FL=1